MKNTLLTILLLLTQIAFGQSNNRVKVPGTKCTIIPPEDFVASTTFGGFQNNSSGASIMIQELPAPYQTIINGFTEDALKTNAITLISKQTIDFHNRPAILVYVSKQQYGINFIKQILIFGDSSHVVMASAAYPEEFKSLESRLNESLLSTEYDSLLEENILDAATFMVDVSNTDLKAAKYLTGSILYTVGGKINPVKPSLVIANSISVVAIQNREEFAKTRLMQLSENKKTEIKQFEKISIDNLDGYEIIADRKTDQNTPEQVYFVILFTEKGGYYLILGETREKFDTYIQTFRKVAKTFKRK